MIDTAGKLLERIDSPGLDSLVIRGQLLDELVRTCNTVVGTVRRWIAGIGIKLADHKTDVLLISSRKKMEFITITVGDQRITVPWVEAIKYLGMVIDNRLTFREHLTYIGVKCAATSCALARIMSNLGGPKKERRWLLVKVVTSIAIYAAPI